MSINFEKKFRSHCNIKNLELNQNQIFLIKNLENYYKENFKNYFLNFFSKKNLKKGFYLYGDVGVGKTMILDFFFNLIDKKKHRLHFNEFMLNFHDFVFKNKNDFKENAIDHFVKDLNKKLDILYFDEFQVTNIVDAMILGKLFKKIFEEDIKVIFSSNIKINNLYKDGLQREQFLPFIKILKEFSHENELIIEEDYRTNNNKDLERFLFPLNQSTNFKLNKFFRKLTRDKSKNSKTLNIKGRKLELKNFYEGILRLNFEDLCNRNLGAEDYIAISNNSNFIFLENLPNFNENNLNQQQRFITFIDIIYEKKIPLMITSEKNLKLIESSNSLRNMFKRTISRLYELTSLRYN